jgi:hypothetical protein
MAGIESDKTTQVIEAQGGYVIVSNSAYNYTQAEQLCTRMIRVGIACLPMPYAGIQLPK